MLRHDEILISPTIVSGATYPNGARRSWEKISRKKILTSPERDQKHTSNVCLVDLDKTGNWANRKLFCRFITQERDSTRTRGCDACVCRNYHWCANCFFSRSFRCLINWENPDLKNGSEFLYYTCESIVASLLILFALTHDCTLRTEFFFCDCTNFNSNNEFFLNKKAHENKKRKTFSSEHFLFFRWRKKQTKRNNKKNVRNWL